MDEFIEELKDGRFILASWIMCAGEWYAVPVKDGLHPVTARTLEQLAKKRGVKTYTTYDDALAAALSEA